MKQSKASIFIPKLGSNGQKSTINFEYFLFSFRAVPKSADRVRPDRGRAFHASTEHRDPPSHWGHAAFAPTSSRCRACKSSIIASVSLKRTVQTVQQTAALALGRLANYNDDLAEAVVKSDILPQLVYSLAEQNRFYKKAAAFVLRAVAKHSPQLAQTVSSC